MNRWIREEADFDAVLDFDELVKDPNNSDLINPLFDCDGIHPNVFGYFIMGNSIDLKLLKSTGPKFNHKYSSKSGKW